MARVTFYGGPCKGEHRTIASDPADGDTLECRGTTYYLYRLRSGSYAAIVFQAAGVGVAPKPANVLRGWADFRNTVQAHIPTGSKRAGLLVAASRRNLHRVARFHG